MYLSTSSDLPKKGNFYKAKHEFDALSSNGDAIKIKKDSHILILRGGKNIQFLAKLEKKAPVYGIASLDGFSENCIVSEAISDPSDITTSYTVYKAKHLENGGFSYKLLENNIIIGDVFCAEYKGTGVPDVKLTAIASCSIINLKKKIKNNRDNGASLKIFLYYLYLGYSGFVSFDEFCHRL